MEKFKGLATEICGIHQLLQHKHLMGKTKIFLRHKHNEKLILFYPTYTSLFKELFTLNLAHAFSRD